MQQTSPTVTPLSQPVRNLAYDMKNFSYHQNADSLLKEETVCDLTQLSRVTIWRFYTSNRFPAPVKLPGSNRNRWKASEVFAWINGEWQPQSENSYEG